MLARGRLARPWGQASHRSETDEYGATLYDAAQESDRKVAEQVFATAALRGVPPGQVALAWIFGRYPRSTPIVGISRLDQLEEALASVDLALTADELAAVEAPYVPHAVKGFA